jgi:hypothetical protein
LQQLKEKFVRNLTSIDSTKLTNRVVWDYTEMYIIITNIKVLTVNTFNLHRGFVPMKDDEETVVMFHLESELFFKESMDEMKDYPFPLSEDVEDPEEKAKALPPPPETKEIKETKLKKPPTAAKQPEKEDVKVEEAEDADEKGETPIKHSSIYK